MASAGSCSAFLILTSLGGLGFAYHNYKSIEEIPVLSKTGMSRQSEGADSGEEETARLVQIHNAIEVGAKAFLWAEYKIVGVFCAAFAILILSLVAWGQKSGGQGVLTAIAYLLGCATSILSGYIGMTVAVFSNVRTTIGCQTGFKEGFNAAFRAGGVMGYALTSLGLLVLYITMLFYSAGSSTHYWATVMDCIAGFGLGGSTIALFGRVGGGIYTKAADVGADLVGKVVHGIPEDSPKNPAVVADLVGDNVGDIAGMGADLFGSFAESTCAALVIAAQNKSLYTYGWSAVCYPMIVSACGIIICAITSFIATHIKPVLKENDIDWTLRVQMVVSAALMIPATYIAAVIVLPANFDIVGISRTRNVRATDAFVCVILGTIGGMITGLFTDYYTSTEFKPVKDLARSCLTGPSTNIIYGLALGYLSVVAPVFVLAFIVYVSFQTADVYGVALAAVGMLGALATSLTIDGFGPVSDNAGGIAEMAELAPEVRERTDALDAAGNTTAAIGKGFAIGSAALVSLALFGAFTSRINNSVTAAHATVHPAEILQPMTFSFMLIGAALPYWFSAMTMKSVGSAAMKMITEVESQFKANPNLLNPASRDLPDYARCVAISTQASLGEMIAPGALVILAPLITGTFFGVYAVYGLLTGGLLSGVQLATSMSNTGGAWDNAKKLIGKSEKTSEFGGKGSDAYKAAVVGDTVGDPLKDTSGPSLNILMKLMAIISLVFADYFYNINDGKGLFNLPSN